MRAGRDVIDTHCHLDQPAFAPDRDEVLARAAAAGVTGVVVPAIRPREWTALAALRGAAVRIAIGVHPQAVAELDEAERALLARPEEALAAAAEAHEAIAVGECGLDGAAAERPLQERLLRAHLRVARAMRRPVILHAWRCHDVLPSLLREEGLGAAGGVLHSYSGGAQLVPSYAALGLSFGFAGPVTYPGARRVHAAVRAVPSDRLLIETDAPDQAPHPHRGQRSEPAFLVDVVTAVARVRGVAPEAARAQTFANARRLFGW